MERPANKILVLLGIAVVLVLLVGYGIGTRRPFEGKFDNVALTEIKGDLTQVKSFQTSNGFKFVWLVKVANYTPVNGTASFLPTLSKDDVFAVDIVDSRANLYINATPVTCYPTDPASLPRVCEYEVTQSNVSVIVGEKIGSSGLPETTGAPR